jgi:hypothetical protein
MRVRLRAMEGPTGGRSHTGREDQAAPPSGPWMAGVLEGIGLPALMRFLGGLRVSGRLRLTRAHWVGDLTLAGGDVVGAAFGPERGGEALEAISLALTDGDFAFEAGEVGRERDSGLPEEAARHVQRVLDEYRSGTGPLLSPTVVYWAVDPMEAGTDGGPVSLDRGTLHTLTAVAARGRTVDEIAAFRGLARSVREIATLSALGLVSSEDLPPAPPPPPAPPARQEGDDGPRTATDGGAPVMPEPEPAPPPVREEEAPPARRGRGLPRWGRRRG